MKYLVVRGEYFPFYYLDEGDSSESIEVPEELVKEFELVLRDVDNMNARIAQLYWRRE